MLRGVRWDRSQPWLGKHRAAAEIRSQNRASPSSEKVRARHVFASERLIKTSDAQTPHAHACRRPPIPLDEHKNRRRQSTPAL